MFDVARDNVLAVLVISPVTNVEIVQPREVGSGNHADVSERSKIGAQLHMSFND